MNDFKTLLQVFINECLLFNSNDILDILTGAITWLYIGITIAYFTVLK